MINCQRKFRKVSSLSSLQKFSLSFHFSQAEDLTLIPFLLDFVIYKMFFEGCIENVDYIQIVSNIMYMKINVACSSLVHWYAKLNFQLNHQRRRFSKNKTRVPGIESPRYKSFSIKKKKKKQKERKKTRVTWVNAELSQ